jgi:hypothetical protein
MIKMYDEPHPPIVLEEASKDPSGPNSNKFLSPIYLESYVFPIKTLHNLGVKSILEVGPGDKFVAENLRRAGYTYDTLDIVEATNPTILSSLENLDPNPYVNTYDVSCAFQVLEHIPYDKFCASLKKLAIIAKKYVVISLPYSCDGYKKIHNKWKGQNNKIFDKEESHFVPTNLPNRRYRKEYIKEFPWAVHYWEIGRQGFPLSRIISDIESSGLTIITTNHSANPYHYFIVMSQN